MWGKTGGLGGGVGCDCGARTLDALRYELGIAYSKGGRIAMSITVDGIPQPDWTPDNPGSLLIADLAKMLVEGLASRPKPALAANGLAENSFAIWRFRRYNENLAGVGLLE